MSLIWLCPYSGICQNQTRLTGHITDASRRGIPDINVVLNGPVVEGTSTAENGSFTIFDIPPGDYNLTVSGIGYQTKTQIVTLRSGNDRYIEISLKESTVELEAVTVLGESESTRIARKGYEIESIEMRPLQAQSIELNRILDQTSGIKVRRQGGLGSRANYFINGLGDKAVRFFLDGIPMDYFGSSYSVNTIPISLIQRVDIYKGVVPAELCNDALGGAINLVTRQQFNNSAELSYSYGSFNTHRASLLGNWRADHTGFTFKLSAFYNHSDNNYQVWGDDIYVTDPETFEIQRGIRVRRFHDVFDSRAVKADAGFTQKKWADQFLIGVLLSGMDKEIQHGATMEVPFGEATYEQQVTMPYLIYKKSGALLEGLDVNTFSSYSKLVRARVDSSKNIYNWYGEIDGQRTLGGEQIRTLNTLTEKVFLNRINLVYHLNNHLSLGYNYVFNDLRRTDRDPLINIRWKTDGYYAPQRFKKHSMGWVFESEWMDKRLNASVFVKWFSFSSDIKLSEYQDGIETYNTVHSGKSNIGYGIAGSFQLSPTLKLNASTESAIRLPEANEILGDGLIVDNNPDLGAESSLNINLGLDLKLFEKRNNRIRLSSNAFYRDVNDRIQQTYSTLNEGQFVYRNIEKVLMKGVDARLRYFYKGVLTFNQTVSYLSPIVKTDKDVLGNDNILRNSRLPNIPFFQTNTELRLSINKLPWGEENNAFFYWNTSHVGAFYRRSEEIGAFNKDKIPSQWINNCGFGYSFLQKRMSLSFDIHNIFNEQAFDDFAIQRPGRAVYIKTIYKIINKG